MMLLFLVTRDAQEKRYTLVVTIKENKCVLVV